ncbi:Transcription factor RfeG [Colletotrichum higginsianum IMI 349063]|uniref:Transcription factor RfeG n=2 Tax=Colletotrichum higginsianum TaxID=80884 RepID=A0A1B7Y2K7_COLHI|nr:Transcription factor RfeG [Colletotrichum higginsianum IMI 349063]OBR06238.1 Transcription factor RfeG [Colletotrichum higginsianum IMI 349063]TIC96848.1 hypothetical protein CH35J_007191 [Colletotrichum higginsianum]
MRFSSFFPLLIIYAVMAKNIGDLSVDIIASFHNLLGALEDSDDGSVRKRLQYKFRDQLARLRVWSGDTGALDRGQDSLESRLRDASHIRTQILELLNDLAQSLKDARDIMASFGPSWNGLNNEKEVPDDVDAETEGTEIATDITDLVDCLSRLSFSIHNPAPHDEILASKVTDAESFEQQDIQHVRTRFAGIKYYLARRLGKAISRRREYFQYLKTSQPGFRSRGSTNESQLGPKLKPLLTPEQVERIISAGDLSDDDDSDLGDSQSIHQTPRMASQKTKDPRVARQRSASMFTSLLKGATDISVECPYCYTEISVRTASSLKKHLLGDLKPFNCLAEVCAISENSFSTLDEWMQHMLQNHLRTYRCPVLCKNTFISRSDCAKHLAQEHPESIPEHHVDALIRLSSEPLDPDMGVSCPMCLESLPSLKNYKTHVGDHLMSLALVALPEVEGPERSQEDDGIERVALDTGSFITRPISPGGRTGICVTVTDNEKKPSNYKKTPALVIEDTKQPPRSRSQQPPAREKPTGVTPGKRRSTSPLDDSWQPRVYLPSQMAPVSRARPNEYFVPKEGISREVIAANICKYLGLDAIARPCSHTAMVIGLKAESVRWEAERQKRAPSTDGDNDMSARPSRPARLLRDKASRYDASLINDFNNELPNHEIQSSLLGQFSWLVDGAAADHVDLPFDPAIGNGTDLDTVYLAPGSADSLTSPSFARDIDATRPYMTRPSYSSTSKASYPSPSVQSILYPGVALVRGIWASAAKTPAAAAAAASTSKDADTQAEIPIADIHTQMSYFPGSRLIGLGETISGDDDPGRDE